MNNKDKLLCLFEEEGIDIKKYRSVKESIVFDEKRNEYLSNCDNELKSALNSDYKSYDDLCRMESSINMSERKVYQEYPSNPFISNYKSSYINDLLVSDCRISVSGEKMSIRQIADSNITNKEEVYGEIKEKWYSENREYIKNRKGIAINYIEQEYFKKHKHFIDNNTSFLTVLLDLIFIIFFVCYLLSYSMREIIPFEMNNGFCYGMISIFGVLAILDFILIFYTKDKTLDRVAYQYNRIFDRNDSLYKKMTSKFMLGKNRIGTSENLRKKCDLIDKKYLSVNGKAPFVIQNNLISVICGCLLFSIMIFTIVEIGLFEGFIVAVCFFIVRGIF